MHLRLRTQKRRWPGLAAAGLLLGLAGGEVPALAGQREISRDNLVTILEQGPGPSKGSIGAPVVLVEFSDFQCTFCQRFWQETLPKIEEQYIRTGKVRFVYRHLAILGEASVLAAQASACAHDQGKFWEYHDTLFRHTSPLAFRAARLKQYAVELGLDQKTFAGCLDKQQHAGQVEAETIFGNALGATGTPAFLITGQLVIGAHPFETFQRLLDTLLAAPPRKASGRGR